jgi:hypothetical protein
MQNQNNDTTTFCGHANVAIELLEATRRIDPQGLKETRNFLIDHLLVSLDSEVFDDVEERRNYSNAMCRLNEIVQAFENIEEIESFHAVQVGSEIIKQGILKLQSQEVRHD